MTGRDHRWFDALFSEHVTAITAYFLRRTHRADVEDLAADVFTTAWRRRDDVPEGFELPWLYRTAGFTLANHRRKIRDVPTEHLPESSTGSEAVDAIATDLDLAAALGTLSPSDREVLILHAWEGLNGTELAEVLGLSRGGAAARLSRARARLREALG